MKKWRFFAALAAYYLRGQVKNSPPQGSFEQLNTHSSSTLPTLICDEQASQAQKVRQDLPSRRERSNDTLSEAGLHPAEGDDRREG